MPEPFFGVGSTPLLEGDKLIVMVGGQPNAAVVALDALTGRTLWENGGKTNWDGATTLSCAVKRLTAGLAKKKWPATPHQLRQPFRDGE